MKRLWIPIVIGVIVLIILSIILTPIIKQKVMKYKWEKQMQEWKDSIYNCPDDFIWEDEIDAWLENPSLYLETNPEYEGCFLFGKQIRRQLGG